MFAKIVLLPINNIFARTFLFYQFLTRILLSSYAIYSSQIEINKLPEIIILGLVNDIVAIFFALPVIYLLTTIIHIISFSDFIRKFFAFSSNFLMHIFLMFIVMSEIFFWDEFGTKFNFIAVDYLIYTHEIIGTVRETIPIESILMSMALVSLIIIFLKRRAIINSVETNANIPNISVSIILSLLAFYCSKYYDPDKIVKTSNNYSRELTKNGPYQFVYAYLNNELDYRTYYKTIDDEVANATLRKLIKQNGQKFTSNQGIEREIDNFQREDSNKKPNVVVIVVESLSAEYMGKFGNKNNLTPFLDNLADNSLFFTNLYATGTRTVRGLEALTLSIPPTPGSSILRRPNNENMFSIATILSEKGYNMDFLYGGYSYFDNMKYFYENNGFKVTDRRNFKKEEITFSNIWGIADEDSFNGLVKILDNRHDSGNPFFSMMVTTTNHRPYTFPEGTVDMPQKERNSVVRYTDYAIEKFFEQAKTKPWFDNTIFVIVADHCASSAGKTSLPHEKYHIPLIIHSPKMIKPRKINSLASQIDIAPTLMGLLKFNYTSKFFGNNLLIPNDKRAFISTYQLLGYMKHEHGKKRNFLVILSPKAEPKVYRIDSGKNELVNNRDDLIIEAVSYFQTAYDFFDNHRNKN